MVMLIVFTSYVFNIAVHYGVLSSISESYYRLPSRWNFLFTLFCWGFAIPAMILGNSALMFFAGASIAFVGAASAFKTKMTGTVHGVGAAVGMILAQAAIFFDHHLWYVNLISLSLIGILYLRRKTQVNFLWWIEIVSFLAIMYALW